MCQRLIKYSKLTNRQINQIIELFVLEIPATKAARIVTVNRHSVDRIYTFIRSCIAKESEGQYPTPAIVYTSYHLPIFGILERDEKIFTRVIEDIDRETLRRMIHSNLVPPVVAKTESYNLFSAFILDGRRVYSVSTPNANKFWSYAKIRLKKYCGVSKTHFSLYLKEMEFRYNHRYCSNLAALIKEIMKKH